MSMCLRPYCLAVALQVLPKELMRPVVRKRMLAGVHVLPEVLAGPGGVVDALEVLVRRQLLLDEEAAASMPVISSLFRIPPTGRLMNEHCGRELMKEV